MRLVMRRPLGSLLISLVLAVFTAAQAQAQAASLLRAGARIDLGLTQINSANLARFGLDLQSVFDPCRNLAAAARLLEQDYERARQYYAQDQAALRAALSAYNTGSFTAGFPNGYVQAVLTGARPFKVPPIALSASAAPPSSSATGPVRIAAFAPSASSDRVLTEAGATAMASEVQRATLPDPDVFAFKAIAEASVFVFSAQQNRSASPSGDTP